MEDISPLVRQFFEKRVYNARQKNRAENRLRVKSEVGTATFYDANEYAELVGQDVAEAIRALNGNDLPNGMMYYNIAEKSLRPVLEEASERIMSMTDLTFVSVDQAAGIGLVPIRPSQEDKIQGIIDLASSKPWNDVKLELSEVAITFARKVVDQSVQVNADFHYKAGRTPKIIRTPDRGACDWCREVAGKYNYFDVKNPGNDVFRRHDNCKCTVVYDPGEKKKRETVWGPSTAEKKAYKDREAELKEQLAEKDREFTRVY